MLLFSKIDKIWSVTLIPKDKGDAISIYSGEKFEDALEAFTEKAVKIKERM